jgi:23S rRNA pseudoU1915 N3-methylase RlmH
MKSNSLVYKTQKQIGDNKMLYVSIRLNDECKNGHQDFAITGDIYRSLTSKADKYFDMGGCIHEEIEKHFPKFKMFIDLHLCDYSGAPMYPTANGLYHMQEGFNDVKPDSSEFASKYCEYYRVTKEQFDILKTAKNKVQFGLLLDSLGILEQWKEQADIAIKELEAMTGNEFINDSKRSQHIPPTAEEIAEENEKLMNGYYTPEAEEKRKQEQINIMLEKLDSERIAAITKINAEHECKVQVLMIGGKKALDNIIFYSHNMKLAFNWRGYGNLLDSEVDDIIRQLDLPEGVTIENKKK